MTPCGPRPEGDPCRPACRVVPRRPLHSIQEMKKRLRRKKHRGEFSEYGRHLVVTRNTKAGADAFHHAFLLEAIEANGCWCGGSLSDDRVDVVVELGRMADDPEARFARVTGWLDARPDVEGWRAGELADLWYGNLGDNDLDADPWKDG